MNRKLHFPNFLSLFTFRSVCFYRSKHCFWDGMQRYLLLSPSVTCSFCRQIVVNHLKTIGDIDPPF